VVGKPDHSGKCIPNRGGLFPAIAKESSGQLPKRRGRSTVTHGAEDPSQKLLVLGQQQLEIIQNSEYLVEHFCLLIHLCNGLICYRFSAEDKNFVAECIRKGPKNLNKCMAIGDGLNDIMMMETSDASVQLSPVGPTGWHGDFVCTTFHPVNDFMFHHMINFNQNYESFVTHYIFKNILLCLCLMLN
jgi:hypothetical protein